MKRLSVIFFSILYILITLNSFAQKINPGDGIRISFLDIKDVTTGDFYIQPNGLINLPLIGVINTNNRDFEDIKAEIVSRYSSLYKDPQLSVNALYRINILGEVKNPGFYYVSDYEKFTSILAFAGGPTANADLSSIVLIRDLKVVDINVEKIIRDGSTVADFGLQSGDQIYVGRNWWSDNYQWMMITISVLALAVTIWAVIFTHK